ncbi:MAG: UDP-3-O-(3-hydroxymyristoyl)glucosamine N-acyltransferase [Pyrinomonadaceae bacterium]|nr:UDP-3-O-(3-hydroxymyristoyl)glucosamine N-acyltransferase [Pyrinomonadaceae bacterium]
MQNKGLTVAELAALVGGRVLGDESVRVTRVASLADADADAIAFVESMKLLEEARTSQAACVIVPEGGRVEGKCVIEAARPKLAFALIAEALHPPKRRAAPIHQTAHVAASARLNEGVFVGACAQIGERAQIGAGTQIYAGAIIGDGVSLGKDCVIHPNVVLYDGVTLGNRVILHAGACIGADGFGYVRGDDGYHKFPQVGTVVIEDDVEIGAGTCVDRGALGETRIGRGTKIDNLVQIAHNVRIGAHVVIASQTGISGSTVIEDDAIIGGQVGFGDHARVERGAVIGSKAGVLPGKIVRAGTVMWGVPVRPLDEYKRLNAHFGRLPQMRAEIDELRRLMKELQERGQGSGVGSQESGG